MADAVTAVLVQGNGELGNQKFRQLFDIMPFTFTFDVATALADASGTGATHEVVLTASCSWRPRISFSRRGRS